MRVNKKCCIVLLLSGFVSLFGVDNNLRNQFVIEQGLQTKLDSTFSSLLRSKREINIAYKNISDEKIAFLKTFFVDYFDKRGVVVRIDSALFRINVEQFDVNIVYTKSSASLWGVSEKINRKVSVILKGLVENRMDNRYIPLNINMVYADVVNVMDLDFIENSPYTFTKGVSVNKSSWKNFIEPVVVSVSVATVIFLFFVLRT
jgi:hypothetical protein